MDDAKLKAAKKWDYFDEWLARIRDIRASEKRFWHKVRDLFTTAVHEKDVGVAKIEQFMRCLVKQIFSQGEGQCPNL
jgi:hypothetical protein